MKERLRGHIVCSCIGLVQTPVWERSPKTWLVLFVLRSCYRPTIDILFLCIYRFIPVPHCLMQVRYSSCLHSGGPEWGQQDGTGHHGPGNGVDWSLPKLQRWYLLTTMTLLWA